MRSGHLVAALRAELCPGLDLGSAAGALVLRAQRLATLGTEFGPLRSCATGRAERSRLARQIQIFGQILSANFDAHLLDGGLGLLGGQFDLEIRSALKTKRTLRVPTRTDTHP